MPVLAQISKGVIQTSDAPPIPTLTGNMPMLTQGPQNVPQTSDAPPILTLPGNMPMLAQGTQNVPQTNTILASTPPSNMSVLAQISQDVTQTDSPPTSSMSDLSEIPVSLATESTHSRYTHDGVGTTTLRIHRVNVLSEMVEIFKSEDILASHVKFELVDEAGADATGVSREVYSEFWKMFMSSLADGEEVQGVPLFFRFKVAKQFRLFQTG